MHRRSALTVVVLATAFVACSKGEKKTGPVVAEGGGVTVTSEEFKARLDEQSPFIRARYSTLERKKEFLENLIRFELLAKEAERKGLDKDPEVRETLKKIMVQKLVRQAFDEGAEAPSESDAKAYYDEHLEEFQKPERVRVSVIFFEAAAGSPDRSTKAALAKQTLAKLKVEEAKNPLAYGNVARDVSEDAVSRTLGGDLGYRTEEELGTQYTRELAAAAFALRETGQTSSVIETSRGFAILKLNGRQAAVNRGFDEVKGQLVARIGREKRTKDFDAYVKGLREKSGIKVNDAELEKVPVEAAGNPNVPYPAAPVGAPPAAPAAPAAQ